VNDFNQVFQVFSSFAQDLAGCGNTQRAQARCWREGLFFDSAATPEAESTHFKPFSS
jgi:hypothetical protein